MKSPLTTMGQRANHSGLDCYGSRIGVFIRRLKGLVRRVARLTFFATTVALFYFRLLLHSPPLLRLFSHLLGQGEPASAISSHPMSKKSSLIRFTSFLC
jgi:hypothetical protein